MLRSNDTCQLETGSYGQYYYGMKRVLELHCRTFEFKQWSLSSEDLKKLNLDDSIHILIPINANETSVDLKYFAEIVHEKDVILSVDITSIHPSLQDPFKLEADIVIQSATKYCDRCSEVLAVLIFVKTQDMKNRLLIDRIFWAVTSPIWKHSFY